MVAAVRVHEVGGPEVLTYEDIEVPAAGPGQIRVKQHAIGVNFVDTYFRSGLYPAPGGLPFVAGNEAAGEVVEVGAGVSEFKPGDRVAYVQGPGCYTAERFVPPDRAVKLPANISYEQAAGMMLKGLTVQYLVRRTFKVEKGMNGLMHGAAGRGRRRRSEPLPMGQSSRGQCDRNGRLEGQGRARTGKRMPPHDPLQRRGF